MQTIKKILKYLFGFYAMIMFTVIGLPYLVILITILKTSGKKSFENGLRFTRFWARSYLFSFGMPLKAIGREHFEKGQTYVIVSNLYLITNVKIIGALRTRHFTYIKTDMIFGTLFQRFNQTNAHGLAVLNIRYTNSAKPFPFIRTAEFTCLMVVVIWAGGLCPIAHPVTGMQFKTMIGNQVLGNAPVVLPNKEEA